MYMVSDMSKHNNMRNIILLFILCCFICFVKENSLASEVDRGIWKVRVESAVSISKGNSNYNEYKFTGAVSRKTEDSEFTSKIIYNRSKSHNKLVLNNIILYNEFDYIISDILEVFGSAGYERDFIKNVELRTNSFYGLNYVVKNSKNKCKLKIGAGVEYEDTLGEELKIETAGRSGYEIDYFITDIISFGTSLEVTYLFLDMRDFRLGKEAYIKFRLTDSLFVKTGFESYYRNRTPINVRKWDTKFFTSIIFEF